MSDDNTDFLKIDRIPSSIDKGTTIDSDDDGAEEKTPNSKDKEKSSAAPESLSQRTESRTLRARQRGMSNLQPIQEEDNTHENVQKKKRPARGTDVKHLEGDQRVRTDVYPPRISLSNDFDIVQVVSGQRHRCVRCPDRHEQRTHGVRQMRSEQERVFPFK